MGKPSDREYKLMHKIRDLEEQNRKLETEIVQLKKKLEKQNANEPKKYNAKAKKDNGCPTCGADVQVTVLPFGRLKICKAACGWREVVHD
jgi:FKBP-type peptidyl-prolyl cis-trans isomerase